ncbi:hypothetical protein RN607_11490 [Demequina capsici]|uniref:Uncharacterized protein n=1 Tax=Demequina capsici TaxID=3075620 RepID=A0AA96FAT8_9MICO|nr:hypothetical protein [Demequina sp. PMTSA13]WNM26814.1 hypothetical protein RN607_11490 [Demequina sp. PMTSA13]
MTRYLISFPSGEMQLDEGGYCILDVTTRDEALSWAARFAAACRCAQEVRAFGDDPES